MEPDNLQRDIKLYVETRQSEMKKRSKDWVKHAVLCMERKYNDITDELWRGRQGDNLTQGEEANLLVRKEYILS